MASMVREGSEQASEFVLPGHNFRGIPYAKDGECSVGSVLSARCLDRFALLPSVTIGEGGGLIVVAGLGVGGDNTGIGGREPGIDTTTMVATGLRPAKLR